MTKYDRLKEYLMNSGKEAIEISFAEIENILQFPLPSSAYVHNAWWSNNGLNHSQVSRHKKAQFWWREQIT